MLSVVVGAQWGDEGKGKIVDFLSKDLDLVVRYQGGNNAGHTVVSDGKTYKLHLLPSGVVQGKSVCLGAGVVIDPKVLVNEIENLQSQGRNVEITIDPRAHIILPHHIQLDQLKEGKNTSAAIGTTGRGIGPVYEDKASRTGVRFEDFVDKDRFSKKLASVYDIKKFLIEDLYKDKINSTDQVLIDFDKSIKFLAHYIGDVAIKINNYLDRGKNVMLEGAQGTFLDINFGSYPYVTSSHPISGGSCVGAGFSPKKIDKIIGIAKAYTTRVGNGPFPTELKDELGENIRKRGAEFGTTTGRPRRCGWFDLVMLRYSHMLNGFTEIAITKLDVLSDIPKIKIAIAYECDGEIIKDWPIDLNKLEKCKPIYADFDGFNLDDSGKIPKEAQIYLNFIEKEVGVPIKIVSIGAERNHTLLL